MKSFSVSCTICGDNARIYKSENVATGFKKFYIECINPDCRHRFVSNLMFSHTLAEPDNKMDYLIDRLLSLPRDKLDQIQQAINSSA